MKLALVLALLSWLASCAAHNSHRVPVDLVNDFDALVDEAYGQLVQQWPPGEPGGSIGTRIAVEPVMVRWWPLYAESAEAALPIEQAAMAKRVEQRLWQLMGGPPDPSRPSDYVIEAVLETDLHDPETILYGVSCWLARADKPDKELVRGYSRLVQIPRLFCHGCNEALGGHGSRLLHPAAEAAVSAGVWTGFYYCPSPSSGATYTKVR